MKITITLQCWRLRIPKGITNEGTPHLGVKGKLAPKFVGPYQVIEQKGPIS